MSGSFPTRGYPLWIDRVEARIDVYRSMRIDGRAASPARQRGVPNRAAHVPLSVQYA